MKKMLILTSEEKDLLLMSSSGCKYCKALYEKHGENGFNLADLSLREAIHIETTTRRRDVVEKVEELFKKYCF